MDDKGNKTQHDRSQSFGGNRKAQVNNENCVDICETGKNLAPDASFCNLVPTFTPDQYGQIMKLIDKEPSPQEVVANMAGIYPNLSFTSQSFNSYFSTGKDTPP